MSDAKAVEAKLIRAIRDCVSLSQLFALIQREGIVVQMHAQSGASNLTPRTLEKEDKTAPLEKMKTEVIKAVSKTAMEPPEIKIVGYRKKSKAELLKAIDECTSISQLFALVQHEGIVIQMHSQSGASNLTPKKLGPKEIIKQKDAPFERLKAEVRKAVVCS